jgi:hypothetical protein
MQKHTRVIFKQSRGRIASAAFATFATSTKRKERKKERKRKKEREKERERESKKIRN